MGVTVVNVAELIRLKVMKRVEKAAETLWLLTWPLRIMASPFEVDVNRVSCGTVFPWNVQQCSVPKMYSPSSHHVLKLGQRFLAPFIKTHCFIRGL